MHFQGLSRAFFSTYREFESRRGRKFGQLDDSIKLFLFIAKHREWLWVLEEIQELIGSLPSEGKKTLYALWKTLPGHHSKRKQPRSALEQLRDFLLRLSQDWYIYCTFQSGPKFCGPTMPRTSHWQNEDTRTCCSRLQILARHARWLAVSCHPIV